MAPPENQGRRCGGYRAGRNTRAAQTELAVGHRRERGRHIGIAQVNRRTPRERALAAEGKDDKREGEHDSTEVET